jgi:hypothetical protein
MPTNVARWLKPRESFIDEIDITKSCDLTESGKYAISVSREMPFYSWIFLSDGESTR